MSEDRRDPSDFTGGTNKSTGEEVEDAAEALEPSDDPDGPFWTAKRKVKNIGSGLASRVPRYGSGNDNTEIDGGNGNNGGNEGYDDNPDEPDEDRRIFLYLLGALGAGGLAAIGADGADGEVDGEFDAFDDVGGFFGGLTNETEGTPQGTPAEEDTPYDTPEVEDTPEPTPEETPTQTPAGDDIYFNNLGDLPDEACYRPDGGVSGYFEASDIEDTLGEEVTSGLNPSQGDIAYDVDFRDSDGDGEGDAYVIQLAGTDSQNDLTVAQAETLFEELDVDGSYC